VAGLKFEEEEDLKVKCVELITSLGELGLDIRVVNVLRMVKQNDGHIPLVKIELQTKEEKIAVLRNKQKLRDIERYKRIFVRSSKSHIERMGEANMNTLLEALNLKDKLRLTSNGRLVHHEQQVHNAWDQGPPVVNNTQGGAATFQGAARDGAEPGGGPRGGYHGPRGGPRGGGPRGGGPRGGGRGFHGGFHGGQGGRY
jgi:hypothetical protein